jgi:Ca2+-binding EF-hand superfamily protein
VVIDEARRVMKTKNMSIKPAFQDFDRTKSGRVTLPQFVRVCLQFNLNVPDHVLQVFARRYMDKPNSEEVNYVLFCLDIDKSQPIFTPE